MSALFFWLFSDYFGLFPLILIFSLNSCLMEWLKGGWRVQRCWLSPYLPFRAKRTIRPVLDLVIPDVMGSDHTAAGQTSHDSPSSPLWPPELRLRCQFAAGYLRHPKCKRSSRRFGGVWVSSVQMKAAGHNRISNTLCVSLTLTACVSAWPWLPPGVAPFASSRQPFL